MRETHGDDGPETGADASHHETFDPGTDDVVVAVLDTVASARNTDPTALEPLCGAIDPDALSTLFTESSRGIRIRDGRLVFVHEGCVVTVTSDGHVRARATE